MREPAATDEKRSVPCGTGRFFGKPYGWLTRQGLPTLTRRRLRILRQADDLVRGGLHADNSSVEGGGKKTELQLPSLFRPDLHRHDASVAFFGTHQKGPLRPEVAERDILPRVRYGREDPDDPRMALQEHPCTPAAKAKFPSSVKGR